MLRLVARCFRCRSGTGKMKGRRTWRIAETARMPRRFQRGTAMHVKVLFFLVLACLVVGCSRTPVHRGKDAGKWTETLHDPDPAARSQAGRALGALGHDAKRAVPD